METVNLFLEFVQFLADYTVHQYVSIQSIKCVFNLPYFSNWKIILIYKKRDPEIKINVLFTDNMGDNGPNTSITMTAYCVKK